MMFLNDRSNSEPLTKLEVTDDNIIINEFFSYEHDAYGYEYEVIPIYHKKIIDYQDIIGLERLDKYLVIYYFYKQTDGSVQFSYTSIDYFGENCDNVAYGKICDKINKTSNKYLFIVNPVSGSGNSKNVFKSSIHPIFDASFHTFEIHHTIDKSSVEKILTTKKDKINTFKSIVVVGGDGTVFDVVQAMKTLKITIPISIIPMGSGNGLAKSIMGKTLYTPTVIDYVYKIFHGHMHKLDTSLCTGDVLDYPMYSILGQAWGMPSDVDIKSEYMRWLGSIRFTIQTVVELYNMKTYNGSLKYLPYSDSNKDLITQARKSGLDCDNLNCWKSMSGQFIMVWACQTPYMSHDTLVAPDAKLNDNKIHLVVIRSNPEKPIGRYELFKLFLGLEKGIHVENELVEVIPVLGYDLELKKDEDSNLTVDGELINYKKLKVMIDDPIDIIY